MLTIIAMQMVLTSGMMESLSKACFTVPIGGWLVWLLSHFAHKDNISDGNWIEEGVAIWAEVSEFSQTATQTWFGA